MRASFLGSLALLSVLSCGQFFGGSGGGAYENGLLVAGAMAPDVTLYDLDGHAFQLSSLRGKTVLLNFWYRN
jgi:cytochrome oxidase Cu insertion factor (SCO1/SenC/PrrC family)